MTETCFKDNLDFCSGKRNDLQKTYRDNLQTQVLTISDKLNKEQLFLIKA